MTTASRAGHINGIDVDELRGFIESAAVDPTRADRDPVVTARWVGGSRASVSWSDDGRPVVMGGDDDPSAMRMLLMTLAACDVEVVASRAALLGIDIEELEVEASGHFNVSRLFGLDSSDGPGYREIGYRVRLKAPGATPAQLAELRRACEEASPVGDTLGRRVRLTLVFEPAD